MAEEVSFDTTVMATGNNTSIMVPEEVIEQLNAGKRPAVLVNLNGYEYRNTVGVMGGKSMLSIGAAVRKHTGLKGVDAIHVVLSIASSPREVDIPTDFAEALLVEPELADFFARLSNSLQRYHVDNVNAAKSIETRRKRIEKSIALFREGKQR